MLTLILIAALAAAVAFKLRDPRRWRVDATRGPVPPDTNWRVVGTYRVHAVANAVAWFYRRRGELARVLQAA